MLITFMQPFLFPACVHWDFMLGNPTLGTVMLLSDAEYFQVIGLSVVVGGGREGGGAKRCHFNVLNLLLSSGAAANNSHSTKMDQHHKG